MCFPSRPHGFARGSTNRVGAAATALGHALRVRLFRAPPHLLAALLLVACDHGSVATAEECTLANVGECGCEWLACTLEPMGWRCVRSCNAVTPGCVRAGEPVACLRRPAAKTTSDVAQDAPNR